MRRSGIITLVTDFGARDWYVGAVKGVILGIHPRAVIVDITHGIPPGDTRAAAMALRAAGRYFPPGTVHVVVVDPGVGSSRALLCAAWRGGMYLAPDNGILPLALGAEAASRTRSLEAPAYRLPGESGTFHGRDILAPAAAHLAKGLSPRALGPLRRPRVSPEWPVSARDAGGGRTAEVLYVDGFGNCLTSLENGDPVLSGEGLVFRVRGRAIRGLRRAYADAPRGGLLALRGSSGYVEISMNGGSAAAALGARRGTRVAVRREGRR